jgi:hypothetical protein
MESMLTILGRFPDIWGLLNNACSTMEMPYTLALFPERGFSCWNPLAAFSTPTSVLEGDLPQCVTLPKGLSENIRVCSLIGLKTFRDFRPKSPIVVGSLVVHTRGCNVSVTFAIVKTQTIMAFPKHGDHECQPRTQVGDPLRRHSDLEVSEPSLG